MVIIPLPRAATTFTGGSRVSRKDTPVRMVLRHLPLAVLAAATLVVTPGLTGTASAGVAFSSDGQIADWPYKNAPQSQQPWAVDTVDRPVRGGATAMRMESRYQGEFPSSGVYHSEVVKTGVGAPGETRWYGFSSYVPTDWVADSKRVITQQWYGGGDSTKGPTAFMHITGGRWYFLSRFDSDDSDGTSGAPLELGPIARGQWTDWVVQVKWSTTSGFVKVWRNGTLVDDRTGPTSFADDVGDSYNFHIGVYAAQWSSPRPTDPNVGPPDSPYTHRRVLYHDEVAISDASSSNGYDTVDPGGTRSNLAEIVVDNGNNRFAKYGSWQASTGYPGQYVETGYWQDGTPGADGATKRAVWDGPITVTGRYQVAMRWTCGPGSNRPKAAPVQVNYDGGSWDGTVDQNQSCGQWRVLGTWSFTGGSGDYVRITAEDAGYTIADAVRYVGPLP